MAKTVLPLREVSIEELFCGSEPCTYEIPIYQRNYAWEKDEISALVQDVYDAYKKNTGRPYYIGTLVSYNKGDRVYEIIDGQQRLTTIRLLLGVLGITPNNKLTYRARRKSDETIKSIPEFKIEERDAGIENGYKYARASVGDIVPKDEMTAYINFFKSSVHIIHYQVPKDIDLNHYFEIMNSRGEQLEKHEIVKAKLMEKLNDDEERKVFNRIWECCSDMSVYAQQSLSDFKPEEVFGYNLSEFKPQSFEELITLYRNHNKETSANHSISISEIIDMESKGNWIQLEADFDKKDSFLPIIDFPNFLLIVLKISRMKEWNFEPELFNLDDKELLNEFNDAKMDADAIKAFSFNLLKSKWLLDNYIVHHSKEEDTLDSNPWKLQVWRKDEDTRKGQLRNLISDLTLQNKLTHLLSMFEVSFTPRQRKNYLFYTLFYLLGNDINDYQSYATFVESLADKYFYNVYLDGTKLNAINTPMPGSFDGVVLRNNKLDIMNIAPRTTDDFIHVYGDGVEASKGVPLFVFNYLDYKLWEKYDDELRGERKKEGSRERRDFFDKLGCGDFGLKVFDQFYFSRTRRSLEHYYPQATATGEPGVLDQNQINCLGNYAMIGSEANSSGSNWSPKTKLDHYLDPSGKIGQVSVASLKFMIMMQICKDNQTWEFEEIKNHQDKMMDILFSK
ncbi:MAG: DUF262 domain-containing protein [Eubacterium sp.]|nr:DUF262 domain-containing protein [Eubacterium sp.]